MFLKQRENKGAIYGGKIYFYVLPNLIRKDIFSSNCCTQNRVNLIKSLKMSQAFVDLQTPPLSLSLAYHY